LQRTSLVSERKCAQNRIRAYALDHVRHPMALPKPTALERVAGSVVTEAGLTALGAIAGGALAPLLPVLAKSLASERQRKRVEATLIQIAATLQKHERAIQSLSDAQYKLINETVLALLQTTQEEKLSYLRAVVANTLSESELLPEEASILSRVVRDISVEEIRFLLGAFKYIGGVALSEQSQPGEGPGSDVRYVNPDSREALAVSGLLSLGLVVAGSPTWDITPLKFTRIVAKLLALLEPDA
jgi:hypothetical protein